jgi:hypothetical protein
MWVIDLICLRGKEEPFCRTRTNPAPIRLARLHVPIGTIARYDPAMEPDRFDDVEFRVLESPEPPPRPPRRRRHGRWVFAMGVAAVTAGALAAGASALTDSAQAPASKKAAVHRSAEKSFGGGDCPFKHRRAQGFDDAARY